MQLGASGCGWCGHISQLTQPYLHYLMVTLCGGSFLPFSSNYGTTRAWLLTHHQVGVVQFSLPLWLQYKFPKNPLIYIQNQTI